MSSWDDDLYTCPICGSTECVPAGGNSKSKILIIGEFPGKDEIKTGKPFSGATGTILKTELGRLGIDVSRLRIVNMWLHFPNKNEKCLQYSVQQVVKEAKGKQAILLIGSDTVKYFADAKVGQVTGLQVKSDYFSAPIIFACIQPAVAFHNVVGEVRLSLQKFADKVEGLL